MPQRRDRKEKASLREYGSARSRRTRPLPTEGSSSSPSSPLTPGADANLTKNAGSTALSPGQPREARRTPPPLVPPDPSPPRRILVHPLRRRLQGRPRVPGRERVGPAAAPLVGSGRRLRSSSPRSNPVQVTGVASLHRHWLFRRRSTSSSSRRRSSCRNARRRWRRRSHDGEVVGGRM